jgi:hypothetical protein
MTVPVFPILAIILPKNAHCLFVAENSQMNEFSIEMMA